MSGTLLDNVTYGCADDGYVKLQLDKDGKTIVVDETTNLLRKGRLFSFSYQKDLNTVEVLDIVFESPAAPTFISLSQKITSEGRLDIFFYEGTDSTGGSAFGNLFNHNRIVDELPTGTITDSPTVIDPGVLIGTQEIGGGQGGNAFGGSTPDSNVIILKRETKYLIRLISLTSSNTVSIQLDWEEDSDG